jgi:hypothetical protein
MNNKFDELTKSIAQSVTRRGALKKFGVGLAGGRVPAWIGLPTKPTPNFIQTLSDEQGLHALGKRVPLLCRRIRIQELPTQRIVSETPGLSVIGLRLN